MSGEFVGLISFLIATLLFLTIALWRSYELSQMRRERDQLRERLCQSQLDDSQRESLK